MAIAQASAHNHAIACLCRQPIAWHKDQRLIALPDETPGYGWKEQECPLGRALINGTREGDTDLAINSDPIPVWLLGKHTHILLAWGKHNQRRSYACQREREQRDTNRIPII